MKKFVYLVITSIGILTSPLAHSQVLVDVWDYDGGAFSPATYGGAYRPPVLFPNAAENSGATLVLSNLTSGGLGSNSFPQGYGGIYTFFSANVGFALQTSNVLSGVQTISASFQAGGGVYGASSLLLAFNLQNPAVTSATYWVLSLGPVSSPIGPVDMFRHTWTWDVSALGASSGFGLTWTAGQQHEFYNEVVLTQAIPEPSIFALLGIGVLIVICQLRRRAKCTA